MRRSDSFTPTPLSGGSGVPTPVLRPQPVSTYHFDASANLAVTPLAASAASTPHSSFAFSSPSPSVVTTVAHPSLGIPASMPIAPSPGADGMTQEVYARAVELAKAQLQAQLQAEARRQQQAQIQAKANEIAAQLLASQMIHQQQATYAPHGPDVPNPTVGNPYDAAPQHYYADQSTGGQYNSQYGEPWQDASTGAWTGDYTQAPDNHASAYSSGNAWWSQGSEQYAAQPSGHPSGDIHHYDGDGVVLQPLSLDGGRGRRRPICRES